VTGFSYDAEVIEQNLVLFNRMMREVRSVRRDGSAALDLAYVACGRFEGFWELSLNPWDIAAGSLILTESGGKVTRIDGTPTSIYDSQLLATNGHIHEAVSEVLNRKADSEFSRVC
jgi:myo-inositol-1(or 4)-monophosphatase